MALSQDELHASMNLHIADDVVFRDLSGEGVLLNLATGTYYGLDQVGTRIWHLIVERGGTDQIVEALLAEYDVAEGQLRQDVDQLTRQLMEKGLVKRDAGETTPAG